MTPAASALLLSQPLGPVSLQLSPPPPPPPTPPLLPTTPPLPPIEDRQIIDYLYDLCANGHIASVIMHRAFAHYARLWQRGCLGCCSRSSRRHRPYTKYDVIIVCLYKALQDESCDFTMRELMAFSCISDIKLLKLLKILFPKSPLLDLAPLTERMCGYLGIPRAEGYVLGLLAKRVVDNNHPLLTVGLLIAQHYPQLSLRSIAHECGISYDYFRRKVSLRTKKLQ